MKTATGIHVSRPSHVSRPLHLSRPSRVSRGSRGPVRGGAVPPEIGAPLPVQTPVQPGVRDALFLMAHDEYRGFSSRLFPAVLELGLAAATLIDLILLDRARMGTHGNVYPVDGRPMNDVVSQGAWERLRVATPPLAGQSWPGSGTLAVHTAFEVLAPGLIERTRAHLVACGTLVAHRRRLGRVRYAPASATTTAAGITPPRITILDGTLDPQGLALCALVQALQIHDALYLTDKSHLDPHLTRIIDTMRQLGEPLDAIPRITDTLRREADERVVSVYR